MVTNFYCVCAYNFLLCIYILGLYFGGGPCVIVVLKGPHARKGPN